jgi:hypothetical protein
MSLPRITALLVILISIATSILAMVINPLYFDNTLQAFCIIASLLVLMVVD